jgi:hypothetical protein
MPQEHSVERSVECSRSKMSREYPKNEVSRDPSMNGVNKQRTRRRRPAR